MRQIIVSSFMFWKEKFNEEHLKVLEEAGFTWFELFCYKNYLDWKNPEDMNKLIQAVKSRKVSVYSIHAPWAPGKDNGTYDIASLDDRTREKALREIFNAVKIFSREGIKSIVVHPGMLNFKGSNKSNYKSNSIHSLKLVILFAQELGVRVVIENPPPPELGSEPDEFMDIYSSLKDYGPGFCLDTGHAFITEKGIGGFLDTGLIPLEIHISDNHGGSDEHLLPGEGTIEWDKLFKRLHDLFGNGMSDITFNLELGRFPGTDRLSALKKRFEML
ncbi:MAG: sugar phosphate isomerase/epimerase [Spirochaetes bacterium]|nr:sugar phosphate isomerase/epimerase [Spirochaetota bacterium]